MSPKRFFLILCVALGLLLVGGGGAYYWLSTQLQASIHTMSQKQAEQELRQQKLTQLEDLKHQYNHLETGSPSLLSIINKALPQGKEQSSIALQLRNLAQQSGMQFSGLKFPDSDTPSTTSQTVKAGDSLATPVSFQLTGTYDQLQTFLVGQERLSRLTNMTNLNISVAGIDPAGNEKLAFDVTLNVYLKP